ncbi:hypothetical protein [Roseicella sp. DB1501]|uniref:hypothetical protein n=1 Tax=Roseicella sp. DB1501 TaxID=2730925 RepID=UPI0014929AF2|nr:hypothetical protein [Roseicella sp. DB1501]NOG70476.1 hypothetical protein [Roseicella sp. DB1501]
MEIEAAAVVLGVARHEIETLTPQKVGRRHQKRVKACDGAEETARVNAARDVLLDWLKAGRLEGEVEPKPEPERRPAPSPQVPPRPQADPSPQPAPAWARDDTWVKVRAFAPSVIIAVVLLASAIMAVPKAVEKAKPLVRQFTQPCVSYGQWEAYMRRPNVCIQTDGYGRCTRMGFNAWYGNKDEENMFARICPESLRKHDIH